MAGRHVRVSVGEVFVCELAPSTGVVEGNVPVLVVHGGPDWDHHYLLPGLESLAARRRTLAMDLRGCGASSRGLPSGACQPTHVVDDMLAVADAFDAPQVDLLGFSYGGRVVQLFAERWPERVRSLVLASTSAYDADRQTDYQKRSQHWIDRSGECPGRALPDAPNGDLSSLTRQWAHEQVPLDVWDRSLFSSYRALLKTVDSSGDWLAELLEHGLGRSCPNDAPSVLADLDLPTLILHGEFDLTFPVALAADLAREVPHARLEVIAGAGHMAQFEKPDVWARLVNEFLT